MKNKNIMSILGIFMIFTVSGLVSAQGMVIGLPIDKYGVETSIQDYNGNIVSFFLSRTLQLTNLSEELREIKEFLQNIPEEEGEE